VGGVSGVFEDGGLVETLSLADGVASAAGFGLLAAVTSAGGVVSDFDDDWGVPHPASARMPQAAVRSLVRVIDLLP